MDGPAEQTPASPPADPPVGPSPSPADSPHGLADPTIQLERRVRAIGETLERARFAGASPRIELRPDDGLADAVARALAADRFGVPLVIGDRVHHLHEERAWDLLHAAQAAQRTFRFGDASARLDRAAAMAVDPGLQQRLGLWKLIVALVERLVRAAPTEDLRGDPARPILSALASADLLPDSERTHYQREIRRLVETRARARVEPSSPERMLWYVVRARVALAANEPLAALIYCAQLGRLVPPEPAPDQYLTGLLDQTRLFLLLQLGEPPDDDALTAARTSTRDLQAWDVYRALVAHLGMAHGLDPQREAGRYTVEPYRDVDA
jgi:hypothetical protein